MASAFQDLPVLHVLPGMHLREIVIGQDSTVDFQKLCFRHADFDKSLNYRFYSQDRVVQSWGRNPWCTIRLWRTGRERQGGRL